jgi:hypothetical protein
VKRRPAIAATSESASARRQIGNVRLAFAAVRPGAGDPVPELPQRAGVVVVPLRLGEERIDVDVGVEVDSEQQLRRVAHESQQHVRRLLQIALLVTAHVVRIDVERQRTRELRRRV